MIRYIEEQAKKRRTTVLIISVDVIGALIAVALNDRFSWGKKRLSQLEQDLYNTTTEDKDFSIWEKELAKEHIDIARLERQCQKLALSLGVKGKKEKQDAQQLCYGGILAYLYTLCKIDGFKEKRLKKILDHFYIYSWGIIKKEIFLTELFEVIANEFSIETFFYREMMMKERKAH